MAHMKMDLTPETYAQAMVCLGHALVALVKPSVPELIDDDFCGAEQRKVVSRLQDALPGPEYEIGQKIADGRSLTRADTVPITAPKERTRQKGGAVGPSRVATTGIGIVSAMNSASSAEMPTAPYPSSESGFTVAGELPENKPVRSAATKSVEYLSEEFNEEESIDGPDPYDEAIEREMEIEQWEGYLASDRKPSVRRAELQDDEEIER